LAASNIEAQLFQIGGGGGGKYVAKCVG